MNKRRYIGNNNKLMYSLPVDMGFFKTITVGKKIVVGRKTHESIGRPLPGRETYVVTRTPEDYNEVHTLSGEGIENFIKEHIHSEEEVIVCGGAEIYDMFIEFTSKVYLTVIDAHEKGDAKLSTKVINSIIMNQTSSKIIKRVDESQQLFIPGFTILELCLDNNAGA